MSRISIVAYERNDFRFDYLNECWIKYVKEKLRSVYAMHELKKERLWWYGNIPAENKNDERDK